MAQMGPGDIMGLAVGDFPSRSFIGKQLEHPPPGANSGGCSAASNSLLAPETSDRDGERAGRRPGRSKRFPFVPRESLRPKRIPIWNATMLQETQVNGMLSQKVCFTLAQSRGGSFRWVHANGSAVTSAASTQPLTPSGFVASPASRYPVATISRLHQGVDWGKSPIGATRSVLRPRWGWWQLGEFVKASRPTFGGSGSQHPGRACSPWGV